MVGAGLGGLCGVKLQRAGLDVGVPGRDDAVCDRWQGYSYASRRPNNRTAYAAHA